MKQLFPFAALTLFLSLLTVPASAGTIYNNLGPGNSYSGGSYTTESPSDTFSVAARFVASGSGNLGDVLVPVGDDPYGSLSFSLYTNASGQPGTLLESWSNIAVTTDITSVPLLDLTSVAHPFLTAGDQYWFAATSAFIPPDSFGLFWAASTEVTSGGLWTAAEGTPFLHQFGDSAPLAIRLDTAAPEPSSWGLLGCGLLGLALYRRRAASQRTR